MPTFQRRLDAYQGYDFKKDVRTPVGFLTRLRVGDVELAADQLCKDPTRPTVDVNAVAVLTDALWEMGVTDAVYLAGQVSVANRQALAEFIYTDLAHVDVMFRFTVYEYDPLAKRYFASFDGADADLEGLLEKRGADLNLSVADDPSTEVQSPANHAFQVGVKPPSRAQRLRLATGVGRVWEKPWGLTIA